MGTAALNDADDDDDATFICTSCCWGTPRNWNGDGITIIWAGCNPPGGISGGGGGGGGPSPAME